MLPQSTGPLQHGRGVQGQYVYWAAMPHITDEAAVAQSLKQPAQSIRQELCELVVKLHDAESPIASDFPQPLP